MPLSHVSCEVLIFLDDGGSQEIKSCRIQYRKKELYPMICRFTNLYQLKIQECPSRTALQDRLHSGLNIHLHQQQGGKL